MPGLESAGYEMREEFHFPFSILGLIFVIASTHNEHRAISSAMTNIKPKMENGKCSSLTE
jgi:hypothetical protein